MGICPTSSSPGTNQITYLHLSNLPSTHCFLATLFSKILLESHRGPSSWFSAEIVLITKGGDPSNLNSFHPITMSLVIPKLFHKILVKRLETFLLSNGIINLSLQKDSSQASMEQQNIFSLPQQSLTIQFNMVSL